MSRHPNRIGCLLAVPVFILTLIAVYAMMIYPWMSRWGAMDIETGDRYPGDDLVAEPRLRTTRAVTVNAPPEKIWPWLLQLGVDRGGMYSYDWLENLAGLRVRSSNRIVPEWQDLKPGDFIRFTPEDYPLRPGPGVYVKSLDPPRSFVGCFGMAGQPGTNCAGTWQFILEPISPEATRLILRSHMPVSGLVGTALNKAFQFPVFIMEQGMLRGIKARAEQ